MDRAVSLDRVAVYCQYCTQCTTSGASSSGSEVFVSKPFTGTRSDVLARHENSKHHELSVIMYRERLERLSRHQQIQHIIQTQDLHVLTFDEEAFLDALRCLYVLGKQEISHTINYLPFGNFCIQLGNNTLPRLQEAKNCTYTSEQTMNDILCAIAAAIEESLLKKICASPYYSVVLDESTDPSTVKHLGLVVQYIDLEKGLPETKFLKLLDLSQSVHATADVVVNALTQYLLEKASPAPCITKMTGLTCDGAAVMLMVLQFN